MNNLGRALYCEKCTYENKYGVMVHQLLGSITNDGILLIKRAHNFQTLLQVDHFVIQCECGFSLEITLSPSHEQKTTYERN